MSWETRRKTPEEIVARLGNIANRTDIKETQALQVQEIKQYAANELISFAEHIHSICKTSPNCDPTDFTLKHIARLMSLRARTIVEGE